MARTILDRRICYIEMASKDVVTESFYRKVFGWNIRRRSATHASGRQAWGRRSPAKWENANEA